MRSLIACLLIVAATAETVPWSSSPERNFALKASRLPDRIGPENEIWRLPLKGGGFFNSITVQEGRVWCIMNGKALPNRGGHGGGLLVLDLATGAIVHEQLQLGLGGIYQADAPIVSGTQLFARIGADVACLDIAQEGAEVWRSQALHRWRVSWCHGPGSTGLLLGDQLWMTTSGPATEWIPYYDTATHEWPWLPHVMVFDRATGAALAVDEVVQPAFYHGQWSPLSSGVVDGRRLVFWGDGYGYVHAFAVPQQPQPAAEGALPQRLERVWWCDANPPEYRRTESGLAKPYSNWDGVKASIPADGPCEIIAAPVFSGGRLFVPLGRDYEMGKKTGKRSWGMGGLVCIDATGTGDVTATHKRWIAKEVLRTFSTPAIAGGLVFIADLNGFLHCLDAETGRQLWEHDVQTKIWNYPQVVADGKVYLQNEDGEFYVFAAKAEKQLLFQTRLEGKNGPSVGVADGVLVVATDQYIAAYGPK